MPGKNDAQTMPEMIEDGKEQRRASKLYKEQSAEFTDERLAALISKSAAELVDVAKRGKISLTDTAQIKERTVLYLKACEESACFPSIVGLARSMGLSRQTVYDCIWRHSPPETAAWLELCRDMFSDILAESALRNNCNSIVSIFLQKAVYGLRESVEIIAKTEQSPLGDTPTQDELESRIMGSIVVDDE